MAKDRRLDPTAKSNYNVNTSVGPFEWDDRKNRRNKRKHGISFEDAQAAFFDENALLVHDPDHSEEESRFVLLGLGAKFQVLVVCHVYRKGDQVIRIVSARKATRQEEGQYWQRRSI